MQETVETFFIECSCQRVPEEVRMNEEGTGPIPQEIMAAIKKEAITQVAKWFVTGTAALVVLVVTIGWFVVKPWLSQQLGGVPDGAVMAFAETRECPPGWNDFREASGRAIVGDGAPLRGGSKYGFDDIHHNPLPNVRDWPHGGEMLIAVNLAGEPPTAANLNQANIMPWIALHICRKGGRPEPPQLE
jgi:hypothetical protein